MKNAINYFYNFNIDNIRMVNNDYYFSYENKNFILQLVKDTMFDYQSVLELNRLLIDNNKSFFQIVVNKNNEIITNISNQKYILMLDNSVEDRKYDFYDILDTNIVVNYSNKLINKLNRTDWATMWKNKIDYFEMFINHNINKYLMLNKYANYFIGLGENAISYVINTISDVKPGIYDNAVVGHKRITNDTSLKQLYNPLNLVIDHQSRDVAEYLKMIFFNNNLTNVESYLNSFNLSEYGARLIIARMLFPSFFFDLFEDLLDDKCDEKDILLLIDEMNNYEIYILKIFSILKNKYNIPEINWLKKVDYSSTLITPKTSGTSFTNIDSIPSLSVMSIMLQ